MKILQKKTLGAKKAERNAVIAKTPKKLTNGPLERLAADINRRLGGNGHVTMGSKIQERQMMRRTSGIPSIDFITNGGYPKGGLVELGGEFSSGKTSASLRCAAEIQRTTKGAVCWVALEPFSKRFARERGFFLPFSEDTVVDVETGQERPIDPFAGASALELKRMQQAGITDPYGTVSEFMLIQEQRGDVALDAALDALKSNLFELIVVDSLGIAKATKWLEENEVQDASDFPREAKMIGDYTTRCLLALNQRYDDNNVAAKDGKNWNQTTVLHLNHITTVVGTQARSKHKTQSIKGGEGNKHNHHCIIFLWKGEQYRVDAPGKKPYVYAQETRVMTLKSKLGPPYREGSFDMYFQAYEDHLEGDIDVVKDCVTLALIAGLIDRAGAWYEYDKIRAQGLDKFTTALKKQPALLDKLREQTRKAMRT